MSFHPRAGNCEGVFAHRPWLASSGLRSPVVGLAFTDRCRAHLSAISSALSPIAHKGTWPDGVTPAVADRCISPLFIALLHSAPADGLLPQLIDAWCNSKPTAGRGIKAAEFALTSSLVMVWISPTSLIVEYRAAERLARARDDRLLAMISHATPAAVSVSGSGVSWISRARLRKNLAGRPSRGVCEPVD
jgi:hypothetical protein